MATYEYETEPSPETEQSPIDFFKDSLHGMVIDIEGSGKSALGSLLVIRAELKAKRRELMLQSSTVEQRMRDEINGYEPERMQELAQLQEELILLYHEQVWTEGYISDRQDSQ